jgi:hypothetical protein
MALAHGRQGLASSATVDVVADTQSPEVALADLGGHLLRDLSRRERVFELRPWSRLQVRASAFGRRHAGQPAVQPTSFVGRSDEVREVGAALQQARLVTVSGVGKAYEQEPPPKSHQWC